MRSRIRHPFRIGACLTALVVEGFAILYLLAVLEQYKEIRYTRESIAMQRIRTLEANRPADQQARDVMSNQISIMSGITSMFAGRAYELDRRIGSLEVIYAEKDRDTRTYEIREQDRIRRNHEYTEEIKRKIAEENNDPTQ